MLNKIISHKLVEVEERKRILPIEKILVNDLMERKCKNFASALIKEQGVSLIAEVKKASPSKGLIREDFDPVKIAKIFSQAGASAISVLTDQKFFLGHVEYLQKIRQITDLPLLRKEFIIDQYQIYEAKAYGADAVLLIAAVLEQGKLTEYINLAENIGLQTLVEVHTAEELEMVLRTPAKIVGINNRNLKTFETDLNTTFKLKEMISDSQVIVVSESGIKSREDVIRLEEDRIDAMLVGETLMRSNDISSALHSLYGRRSA